jgi:hypothetical protein
MVFLRYAFTVTATGKHVAMNMLRYWRFRAGKACFVRSSEDPAQVTASLTPDPVSGIDEATHALCQPGDWRPSARPHAPRSVREKDLSRTAVAPRWAVGGRKPPVYAGG